MPETNSDKLRAGYTLNAAEYMLNPIGMLQLSSSSDHQLLLRPFHPFSDPFLTRYITCTSRS